MHNLKKFNMNRKYRVRIRCLTFLVTLFWLPLHAQEAGKEFRPAGEPVSYAEKDNRFLMQKRITGKNLRNRWKTKRIN